MKLAIALAAAAAILPAAASAAIVDGSFETQAGASISPNSFCYLGSGCATGAWSSNGLSGFIGVNNPDWPGQQGLGSYIGFIQAGGSLVQTFTANATGRFGLNWFDAGRSRPGYDGPHQYNVTLDGNEIFFGETQGSQPFGFQGSGSFLLTAGQSYTLAFNGFDSGIDSTSFIDGVSMTGVVPEPASWAMMIGGFGLVGGTMRRRKVRTAVAFG